MLKTYGVGLRDLESEPRRPTMSVGAFLLRKALKGAAVVAVITIIGIGVVRVVKWAKTTEEVDWKTSLNRLMDNRVCDGIRGVIEKPKTVA